MLKTAFNSILRLHSRPAQLKRLASPDLYSPCRVTPSNYFRFLRGPESTAIHGREFVVPIDTMKGEFSQVVTFSGVPASGTYKLKYLSLETTDLLYSASDADIQTALRLLTGLSNVTVTVPSSTTIVIVFHGFSTEPSLLSVEDSTLETSVPVAITQVVSASYARWTKMISRGDKIIDSIYGSQTIDEIIEMVDVGGAIMGFRVRCE